MAVFQDGEENFGNIETFFLRGILYKELKQNRLYERKGDLWNPASWYWR